MAQEESISSGWRKDQDQSSQPNPSFKELNMNSYPEQFKRFVLNSATLTQPILKYCLQFSLAVQELRYSSLPVMLGKCL